MDGGRCLCTQTGIEWDHGMISKKEARQCTRLRGAQLPGPTSVLVARVALSEKCSLLFLHTTDNPPLYQHRVERSFVRFYSTICVVTFTMLMHDVY